jgi:hypothetical protein
MGLKLITAPTLEPVTLPELKLHLRVDVDLTDDDTLITSLGKAAREKAEAFLNRAILTQTWDYTRNSFPNQDWLGARARWLGVASLESTFAPRNPQVFELPFPPVQSVTSITYIDTNGVTQTLDPAKYRLDDVEEPARLEPAYGTTWPSTQAVLAAVKVRFVCGWTDPALVPESIKLAIKKLAAAWYDNRTPWAQGERVTDLPQGVQDDLSTYMVPPVMA